MRQRKVFKYGTGETIPKDAKYLCSMNQSAMGTWLVWHYYEVIE